MLGSVLLSIFMSNLFIIFPQRKVETKLIVIITYEDGNDNSRHLILNIYQTTYIFAKFFNWIISLNPLNNALR